MNACRLPAVRGLTLLAFAVTVAACGGGSSGTDGDTSTSTPPVATASGADRFLAFPNPQLQDDGSSALDSTAYASAYYAAIDPGNEKDTLAKWKAANGFDTPTGTQVTVVFGDERDLGYGRRLTGRRNDDGSIAFVVENYQTDPGGAYGFNPLSVEAAVHEDTRWRILVNAIEWSPSATSNGTRFAKFYNFNAATGQREDRVDLDGRGAKAMPGPCLTCHGGRGDGLGRDAAGNVVFPLVENTSSGARGDVQGRFAPLEVDGFRFSTRPGYSRDEQEQKLKALNALVLCSYPLPTNGTRNGPEDAPPCRPPANASEWQGTAAALIKRAYGGDGLPNPRYSDSVVPGDWATTGNEQLYRDVVVPACRGCHLLRGTGAQDDIAFDSFATFSRYADRTRVHAVDRGDMPLAKIIYDRFWSAGNPGPAALAAFLGLPTVQAPGRPVADPGPDRVIAPGATALSAARSAFADTYRWSIVAQPAGANASLAGADTAQPVFSAATEGDYVVELVARRGEAQSAPARLRLALRPGVFGPAFPLPGDVRFAQVKEVLGICVGCHRPNRSPGPAVFFADAQAKLRTDEAAFYADVRSRINLADVVASPLLRKAAGFHHGANSDDDTDAPQPGFDASLPPGDSGRIAYDLVVNWALNGAPP